MIDSKKEKPNIAKSLLPREAALLLWVFFGVLSALILLSSALEFGDAQIQSALRLEAMQKAFEAILRWADAAWVVLGIFCVYLTTAREDGLPAARRYALVAFALALLITLLTAATGFPLGPIRYTDKLGPRFLGVLPGLVPVFWVIVLMALRSVVQSSLRHSSPWLQAGAAALAMLVLDFGIELFAVKLRGWWLWFSSISPPLPGQPSHWNYGAWAIAAFLYVRFTPRPFSGRNTAGGWLALGFLFVPITGGLLVRALRSGIGW